MVAFSRFLSARRQRCTRCSRPELTSPSPARPKWYHVPFLVSGHGVSRLKDLSLIDARPKNAVELKVTGATLVLGSPNANNRLLRELDNNADTFRLGGSCPTEHPYVALELHDSVVQLPPCLALFVRLAFRCCLGTGCICGRLRGRGRLYLRSLGICDESLVLVLVPLLGIADSP